LTLNTQNKILQDFTNALQEPVTVPTAKLFVRRETFVEEFTKSKGNFGK
jgi:hypothetical protein